MRINPPRLLIISATTVALLTLVQVASSQAAQQNAKSSSPCGGPPGHACVIDGDTIHLNGERYRLFGIDAPERKQTCTRGGVVWRCGDEATKALQRLTAGKDVRCEPRDRDKYRRIVAVCYAGSLDLNRAMVRDGWAVAYTRYSSSYASAEREAKSAKRGIWSGEFELPEMYRRR